MKLRPHLTEKSLHRAGTAIYTFAVPLSRSKPEIVRTISKLFDVVVTKITTSTRKPKARRFKRIKGAVSAVKFAYIHLKKGMTIPGFEFSSPAGHESREKNEKKKLKNSTTNDRPDKAKDTEK